MHLLAIYSLRALKPSCPSRIVRAVVGARSPRPANRPAASMGGPGGRGGERADGTAPTARCLRLCGGADRAKAARSTPSPGPSDRVNYGGLAGHDPGERSQSSPLAAPSSLANGWNPNLLKSLNSVGQGGISCCSCRHQAVPSVIDARRLGANRSSNEP